MGGTWRPAVLQLVQVVAFLGAVDGEKEGRRLQSGVLTVLADERCAQGHAPACVLECHSVHVPRIVRSTFAAESAALSTALGRQVDARLLGEPGCSDGWRYRPRAPGVLLADAKSL